MVGPDGVGKTTLLATMYHELSQLDNRSSFEFVASKDTQHDLEEAYQKLSNIIAQPSFTPTGPLLKGTAGLVERQFEIRFLGKKELDLVFCDIAGGILGAKKGQDFEEFQAKLAQAIVIVNVIDGSALIEQSANKNVPIEYDGIKFKEGYRIDLLVENEVIVELKAAENYNKQTEKKFLFSMKMRLWISYRSILHKETSRQL